MQESIKIIQEAFLITCDRQRTTGFFSLLVKDERIAEINKSPEGFKARYPDAEIVDAVDKVLFPGFIDAHYHGESFVLRNWTSGTPMARWHRDPAIHAIMTYLYREASKDELALMYRSAYFSALKSGMTVVSEFCFDNLDTPFAAARDAMKRSDLKGFVGIHNGEQIEQARAQSYPAIRPALVLVGEEELTTYNLQTTLRSASDLQWPIVSHLGETRKGLEAVKKNFRRSVVGILDEYRFFAQPLHLVHCACLSEGDEAIIGNARMPMILNAASLLSKGSEIPPLATILGQGIVPALCSDWGVPDPFANMRALQDIAKLAGADPLDPQTIVDAHTIHAAAALGLQNESGSIEAGKRADITFLDVSDLRLQLAFKQGTPAAILTNLLAEATAQMVSDVMINGEFFLRKRQVMTYAEEDLKREYREILECLARHVQAEEPATQPLDSVPKPAPIIPLTPHRPAPPVEQIPGDDIGESFDEGFRIVGSNAAPETPPPKHEPEENEDDRELPKTVRRVFGEDDN